MEKVIFFCVFSFWIIQTISKDVSEQTLLRFRLNESIRLNCSINDKHEIAWYHQNPDSGRLKLLVFAINSRQMLMMKDENSRLTPEADSSTVSIVLSRLRESDSGLYFCGTRSVNSEMHFENPIRLQMEDKLTDSEDEAHSDAEITGGLTLTERVLMFGAVGLAVVVYFLAIAAAGRNIYYRSWQKGWSAAEHAGLTDQKIT